MLNWLYGDVELSDYKWNCIFQILVSFASRIGKYVALTKVVICGPWDLEDFEDTSLVLFEDLITIWKWSFSNVPVNAALSESLNELCLLKPGKAYLTIMYKYLATGGKNGVVCSVTKTKHGQSMIKW